MRFNEIEDVLGFGLPASARKYQAWWANDDREGRQSSGWLSAGWLTDQLDLAGEKVTFRRGDKPPAARRKSRPSARPVSTEELPDAPGGKVDVAISMQWKHLGTVTIHESGKLVFPETPAVPGLYRLRLIGASGTRHYVGEAVNLKRRFGNYRNPGPTQQTSLRINDLLIDHLRSGDGVAVDIITTGITLAIGSDKPRVDLADKATRRLLEQAALVADHATEIESLNR